MSATKKSDSHSDSSGESPNAAVSAPALSLTLKVTSPFAEALHASLITEAEVTLDGDTVVVREAEPVFVDMRARWNTVVRGLAAADDVLKALE